MSDLYDDDILLWSERQSELLRRLAAGEPLNERPDWPNIIEEVESVGRSDLRAVRSLLLHALLHKLKIEAWPDSLSVAAWDADARLFLVQAREGVQPVHAPAHRCSTYLRQRTDCLADVDGWSAATTGIANLSNDAGRIARLIACPITASATCSVSRPGARAMGRRSAAWSMAAHLGSRCRRRIYNRGWSGGDRDSPGSRRNGKSRMRCASCPACSRA